MWIAPAATTTCSQRHPQPPAGAGARLHGPGRAAAYLDALRARARIRGRARRPGLGHVGHAGVLLGPGRAAERAHARADAAAHVAVQEVARPAQGLHPAPDHRRVAPGEVGRHLHDVELALDAPEPRLHLGLGEPLEAELGAPPCEHGGRGAEARARVDQRGAAHRLAQRQQDRRAPERGDLAGVAVQPRGHLARARGERVGVLPAALLEQRHPHPALGQLLGRHRPAGTGADHAGVDLDRGVAVQLGAVDDPALRRVEGAGAVAVGGVAGRPHQRASRARRARQRAVTASAS